MGLKRGEKCLLLNFRPKVIPNAKNCLSRRYNPQIELIYCFAMLSIINKIFSLNHYKCKIGKIVVEIPMNIFIDFEQTGIIDH